MLRDRAIRLLAAGRLCPLDQPGAVEHPHVKMQVARVDREPCRELAIRQRLLRLAEGLQHLQSQGVTERLELLWAVELEDVGRARLGLRDAHPPPNLSPAAPSRKTSTRGARRERLAGTSAVISAPKARATASALAAPLTRNTTRFA